MGCRRQDDVVRLNAREFFEDRARGVSETGAALPHLEALPQDEGEKADEDVSLNTVLALVPDRTDVQLVLLDAESGFRLSELVVGFPELLIAPIADVRSEEIGAFRDRRPVVEGVVVTHAETETGR